MKKNVLLSLTILFTLILFGTMGQALADSSIVIGLGILAMMVALCVRLYERYGTFDITEIKRLRG